MSEDRSASDWVATSFECAPGLRLQAHERLIRVQLEGISSRQDRLEELLERLDRRLWLTVFGIVGVILAQAFQSIVAQVP